MLESRWHQIQVSNLQFTTISVCRLNLILPLIKPAVKLKAVFRRITFIISCEKILEGKIENKLKENFSIIFLTILKKFFVVLCDSRK